MMKHDHTSEPSPVFCVWNVETGAWFVFCNEGDREPPWDGATGIGKDSMSTSSSCISSEVLVSEGTVLGRRPPEFGTGSES